MTDPAARRLDANHVIQHWANATPERRAKLADTIERLLVALEQKEDPDARIDLRMFDYGGSPCPSSDRAAHFYLVCPTYWTGTEIVCRHCRRGLGPKFNRVSIRHAVAVLFGEETLRGPVVDDDDPLFERWISGLRPIQRMAVWLAVAWATHFFVVFLIWLEHGRFWWRDIGANVIVITIALVAGVLFEFGVIGIGRTPLYCKRPQCPGPRHSV